MWTWLTRAGGSWLVLLRERNMLLTEKEFAKSQRVHVPNWARFRKVKLSMARLQTVLHERRREAKLGKEQTQTQEEQVKTE